MNSESTYESETIQDYSDALQKEINYLKAGKGKRYKIVNGTKINVDKGVYTYSFEMETELHLPDDAPVVINISSGFEAPGTVLVCEDFQILLLTKIDLADKVQTAYLSVEPWKLLEALDTKIKSLNPEKNRIAIELLEDGPKLSEDRDISDVPKGQEEVFRQLERKNILTVWGPPGTGKTHTMASIAKEYIKEEKSVLIVSHSNVSVDGVIKKLVEMLEGDMKAYLENGKVLRFGYVRDKELSRNAYATSFNYTLTMNQNLAADLKDLFNKKDKLHAEQKETTSEYDENEKKIKKIRKEIRDKERRYVEKTLLIGTTISKAIIDSMFNERQFDLVMFDEVSMAYVPQVVAAAALAKEKFMCVGDFRQLAPISQCEDASLLQNDIFSFCNIVDQYGKMRWHPWLVMLNEQRRMHPSISAFSNRYVYQRLLKDYEGVKHKYDDIVAASPLPEDAVHLINLERTYCAADKSIDGSRYNILSAVVSFATAVSMQQVENQSVGIITPYAAQTRLIKAMIQDYFGQQTTRISCATVHQFQGSESDIVIFDAVESYPKSAVGYLMGKRNLEGVVRLINVAVTRARGKLITIANDKFWINMFKSTEHLFYKLLKYIRNGHNVVEQNDKSLLPYIESINLGKNLHLLTEEKEALSMFQKDISNARSRILISLPSGELRETEGQVMELINEADSRGIDILMKSNDYSKLPDAWKKYCHETENALFPLIMIDDKIMWYGLPTAKWKFEVDKSTSLVTVANIIARIKGENTLEMINSLTELEKNQLGEKLESIHEKSKEMEGKSTGGLQAFIEEEVFCPECDSPMSIAKGKKGTPYLRCTNGDCKNREYLTKDIINYYISSRKIKCPKDDGGALNAFLGKYGPSIRCSTGHYLKPEEI